MSMYSRNTLVGLVTAMILALFTLGPAQAAALRTIEFTATGLVFDDAFDLLGIAPIETVTGSITFDTMAPPFSEPVSPGDGGTTTWYYVDFAVDFGPYSFVADPSDDVNNFISVRRNLGPFFPDQFYVYSNKNQTIIPGVTLALMLLDSHDPSLILGGTDVPTVDLLNALSNDYFRLGFLDDNNQFFNAAYNNVVYTELNPVPLPAALPLFLTVIAGIGGLRWWRQRKIA